MKTISLPLGELGQDEKPFTALEKIAIRKRDRRTLLATNTRAGISEGVAAVKAAKNPHQLNNAIAYLSIAIQQDTKKRAINS